MLFPSILNGSCLRLLPIVSMSLLADTLCSCQAAIDPFLRVQAASFPDGSRTSHA
jgi:hypothetical protein